MNHSIVGDLGTYLREQREAASLSLRQLAELAGVSNPYLSQIERGLKRPSAEILQQLARGLKLSAESLYIRAGILDPSHGDDAGPRGVVDAVAADPKLTIRQRTVLLELYRSFTEDEQEPELPRRRRTRRPGPSGPVVTRPAERSTTPAASSAGSRPSVPHTVIKE